MDIHSPDIFLGEISSLLKRIRQVLDEGKVENLSDVELNDLLPRIEEASQEFELQGSIDSSRFTVTINQIFGYSIFCRSLISSRNEIPDDTKDYLGTLLDQLDDRSRSLVNWFNNRIIKKNSNSTMEDLEQRLSKINTVVTELNERISSLNDQLASAKAKISLSQQAIIEENSTFIENLTSNNRAEVDALLNYLNLKKLSIENNEEKINLAISDLASKALSGSFMRNALKEERAANSYRRNAILVMLGLGIFFVLNFVLIEYDLVTREAWLNRVIVGIFFSFLIGYLVRQSAVHRNQQFMYQQKALDLHALSPYVASLPEEIQHKIKHQMAEKLFVAQGGSNCQEAQAFGVQEILGKLLDKLEFPKAPR